MWPPLKLSCEEEMSNEFRLTFHFPKVPLNEFNASFIPLASDYDAFL